jgi:hypothetical protein
MAKPSNYVYTAIIHFTDVKAHIPTDKSEALGARCATCHAKNASTAIYFIKIIQIYLRLRGRGKRTRKMKTPGKDWWRTINFKGRSAGILTAVVTNNHYEMALLDAVV